jgi:DHA1 family tetracycline resistance protein-like MFS transporter
MTLQSLPKGSAGSKVLDWRRILPVFVIVCTYAAGSAAVMPVLPFHIRALGGSPLVLGIVIAAEAVGQFASAPALGQLSDRFGRKRILVASQIIAAASLLLLALAPNVAVILLARALFGLTAGNISVTAAYVADHTEPGNRRQAIGILMGGAGVGGIIGAGLSSLLSDTSLTAPILAALGLVLLSIIVTALRLEDGKVAGHVDDQPLGERISFRAILASPAIRVLVVVMLCHFFAYGIYISQMPVFLGDTFVWSGHAFGAKELSYLIMADGGINVFAQIFLLGWLGKHLTERNLILLIFALIFWRLALPPPSLSFSLPFCVSAPATLWRSRPTWRRCQTMFPRRTRESSWVPHSRWSRLQTSPRLSWEVLFWVMRCTASGLASPWAWQLPERS